MRAGGDLGFHNEPPTADQQAKGGDSYYPCQLCETLNPKRSKTCKACGALLEYTGGRVESFGTTPCATNDREAAGNDVDALPDAHDATVEFFRVRCLQCTCLVLITCVFGILAFGSAFSVFPLLTSATALYWLYDRNRFLKGSHVPSADTMIYSGSTSWDTYVFRCLAFLHIRRAHMLDTHLVMCGVGIVLGIIGIFESAAILRRTPWLFAPKMFHSLLMIGMCSLTVFSLWRLRRSSVAW